MIEYKITVSSPIKKTYLIKADSTENAIIAALEFFNNNEESTYESDEFIEDTIIEISFIEKE